MGLFNRHKDDAFTGTIVDNEFVSSIVPKQGYKFYSDYFTIDDKVYAAIVTIMSKAGTNRKLFPMWGIQLIPGNLGANTTVRILMGVRAETSKWVEKYQSQADVMANSQKDTAQKSGRAKRQNLSQQRLDDVRQISEDLTQNNDSYLGTSFQMLVKSDSLENLDVAINKINRFYNTQPNFGGMSVMAFDGEQDSELKHIFKSPDEHAGGKYHFTAAELAGQYNILTQGIEDETGEYVGDMRGETNANAIIWDINRFRDHVVIGSKYGAATVTGPVNYSNPRFPNANLVNVADQRYQARGTTMWGVKLAQSALASNNRVVHLVLNGSRVQDLGLNLAQSTSYVPMQDGAINPFEIFGDRRFPIAAYAHQKSKMRLLVQQFNPELTPTDLRKYLSKLLDDFYIDKHMYRNDAEEHPEKLRLILRHDQYPRLRDFTVYLAQAGKTNFNQEAEAIQRIETAFDAMSENADIFDKQTSDFLDETKEAPQVIYDFSSLSERDSGSNDVMMAQFVNALSSAVNGLKAGDLVILHGADELRDNIKEYVYDVFGDLSKKHIRTAYLYDDIDRLLKDSDFNRIADADYTLLSGLSAPQVDKYQELLGKPLPASLKSQMTSKYEFRYYLSRASKNVIFDSHLMIDVPRSYKQQYRDIREKYKRGEL